MIEPGLKQSGNQRFPITAAPKAEAQKGLFSLLLSEIRNTVSSTIAALKTPVKLIPVFVLILLWLLTMLLSRFGVRSAVVDGIKLLTFSGYQGSNLGKIVGSSLGKGVYVYALTTLFTSLRNKTKVKKDGEKLLSLQKDALGLTLLGAGAAVFVFSFLSGKPSQLSLAGGLAMVYLSARAFSRNGLIRKILTSLAGKRGTPQGISAFLRGCTLGYALSTALCLLNLSVIITVIGVLLVLAGVVLFIVKASKKTKTPEETEAPKEGGTEE